jgi:membrane protein YdbS with pleckstrin-like domain
LTINAYNLENFTNQTIDTTQLPRFEQVAFTPLHPDYWKVLLIGYAIFYGIFGIGLAAFMFFVDEFSEYNTIIISGFFVLLVLNILFARIGFNKKGFAFRTHDVLFRSGIIATSTIVIPYNRIQHVALHEGLISRMFKLAKIEVFTAGGKESDIEIPGIAKPHAEDIKQLLMGKIQKQL